MTQALYRMFSADGDLLYVGISVSLPMRLKQHEREKPWWSTVTVITAQHFATRDEVVIAELEAIRERQPEGTTPAPAGAGTADPARTVSTSLCRTILGRETAGRG